MSWDIFNPAAALLRASAQPPATCKPILRRGRKPIIGAAIIEKAKECETVAELALATGAAPATVRDVLRRAADRGEIVIKRFVKGKSGRAIRVVVAA
jgi:hypothetical protein